MINRAQFAFNRESLVSTNNTKGSENTKEAAIVVDCSTVNDHNLLQMSCSFGAAERSRIERKTIITERVSRTLSHFLLRQQMCQLFNVDNCDIEIDYGATGQPVVRLLSISDRVFASFSYTANYAAIAWSNRYWIGIDIETNSDGNEQLRKWTEKEAYLKAIGIGLLVEPDTVDINDTIISCKSSAFKHDENNSKPTLFSKHDNLLSMSLFVLGDARTIPLFDYTDYG